MASNMFTSLKKFIYKLQPQKLIKSKGSSKNEIFYDSSSHTCKVVDELIGATEEELEMIKLRIISECYPKLAAKPTEEEIDELNETVEFLSAKNRYLRIQPRSFVMSDGTPISVLVYVF